MGGLGRTADTAAAQDSDGFVSAAVVLEEEEKEENEEKEELVEEEAEAAKLAVVAAVVEEAVAVDAELRTASESGSERVSMCVQQKDPSSVTRQQSLITASFAAHHLRRAGCA